MEIKLLEKLLYDYAENQMGTSGNIENEEDSLLFKAPLSLPDLDCETKVCMRCEENGAVLVYIIFGELEENANSLTLVNNFNTEQAVFKAIINEESELELQHFILNACTEQFAVNALDFVLTQLFEDSYTVFLKPLTRLLW